MIEDIVSLSQEVKSIPYEIEATRRQSVRMLALDIAMNIKTIEKLSNRITSYASMMTSVRQEEQIKPKMEILNISRMMEKKLNETISTIETLSEITGLEIRDLGKLGIVYDGMRYMRRSLLPEIVGIIDSYHGAKEKMDAALADAISKMKKVVNMIVNGEAIPPDEL